MAILIVSFGKKKHCWVTPTFAFAITQVDKFLPLYQCKKILQELRPPLEVFETIPSSGMLSPGEQVNVKVELSPAEGVRT